MLSIIPKEILAFLSSIHKLLNIGKNYRKNKQYLRNSQPLYIDINHFYVIKSLVEIS